VMMAYGVRPFQLRTPSWMEEARYSAAAKIPAGTDAGQFARMMQRLLEDRFQLKVHFEKKSATVYELGIAKGGAKLVATETAGEPPESLWRPPASGPPRRVMAGVVGRGESMAQLATFLADQLGAPVKDATGLASRYDISLRFLMEPGGRAAGLAADDATAPEFGVSLLDAVRQQLGLELRKTQGEVETLVVDSALKDPTAN
jgi:uncharacterized protein (TIGR03435 family)